MAFGFHLLTNTPRSLEQVRKDLDDVAAALKFSPTTATTEMSKRRYWRQEGEPGLSVLTDLAADYLQIYAHPITEEHLHVYGPELLVTFFSNLSIRLDAVLARTFPDTGHFIITASELNGTLAFLDWYQYLSLQVVRRWGLDYLQNGPFYKVESYPNEGCGIWLARSPYEPLRRAKAAEYLGITLPKLYGRNPQTRENVEIPWN